MHLTLLYSPFPSEKSAKQAAARLLSKKLIACANIFPSSSLYFWKGKLQNENEFILLAKTTAAKAKKAESALLSMHPYETPCILKIKADTNAKYANWVKVQTR